MDPFSCPSGARFACRDLPAERFLLTGVHLFDPLHGVDLEGDLLVDRGRIAAWGAGLDRREGMEVLDNFAGCWVFPGFVDPHVHFRTPGYEYKEDMASGSLAAAAGGYVAVVAMANTNPVIDSGPLAAWALEQARNDAVVRVGQVGSVSKALAGEELAEMRELADAGVAGFSDDGRPVADADLLLHALRYAQGLARPIMLHLEDRSLSLDGVMHEGKWSARLGLRGVPGICEAGPMARDLEIVRYADAERSRIAAGQVQSLPGSLRGRAPGHDEAVTVPLVHFQHLSAAASVRLLRRAKEDGLPVSAEVTPLHLLYTDERLVALDQNLKVNPPLRGVDDREALVTAFAEGVIDCVGSDHAPHAPQEKEVPIEDALSGSIALETAFAALHTGLVLTGKVSLERVIEAMSAAPCRVLGMPAPSLEKGARADFCVVDREENWRVTPASLRGKSRNCALLEETLVGRVRMTVVDGARRFARARGEA